MVEIKIDPNLKKKEKKAKAMPITPTPAYSKPKLTTLKPSVHKDLVNEKDIAMDLAQKVHEKFDRIIKASILFGSQAKQTANVSSDIDLVFVVDDSAIKWDLELVAWYREELGKIIASSTQATKREFHVNTIKLSTWWLDLMNGDPVILNILRYGEALIDSGGFFNPIKMLLLDGKIKSTPEAAYMALQRAPYHLARSKAAEIGSIEGVYWAMTDSAQAALITAGKLPPSPEHIPDMLKEAFADNGMMRPEGINALRDIYKIFKSIEYGQTTEISGIEIDRWQDTAEKFIYEMTRIIDKLIESKTEV